MIVRVDMFGGRDMDTFMDKLAQKLTAQEMIRANAAADAEELNRLQNQVKEYNECLAQMRAVNEEMHAVTGQMSKMMEDAIVPKIDQLVENCLARLNSEETDTGRINRLLEASIDKIKEMQQNGGSLEAMQKSLNEMYDKLEEHVHKEDVKVYRNVQAVVIEESNRQSDVVNDAVKKLTGKLNAVFGIAIAALAAALGCLIFQILVSFKVI